MAHCVVTEIAGQPAAKARQAGSQRHLETLLVGSDKVQRVAGRAFHHFAIGHHFGDGGSAKTPGAQQRARRQADKTVTTKALASDHRLQQKAVFSAALGVRQLQVKRQRRLQISKGFCHQWNAVVAFAGQAFEFKFGDQREGFREGVVRTDTKGRTAGSFISNPWQGCKGSAGWQKWPACLQGFREADLRQGQAVRSLRPVMNTR